MKNLKFKVSLILWIFLTLVLSCVQDDDFGTPAFEIQDPVIDGNIIDIDAVLGIYYQEGELFSFQNTNNYVEGYVISNDAGGNFFKQLIIQDKSENPTAGIAIEIDVNPLFTIFEFGRKVYVKLDGLSVGLDNGVIKLGRADGNQISRISASQLGNFIYRSSEVATIVPLNVNISEFSDDLENVYIRLTNVQFNQFDVLAANPKTFASEDNDQFDGERVIESCDTNNNVILSTSTFADFKSVKLPVGSGRIDGILTRDFFDDFFTIYLNTPEDINFDSTVRCDPVELTLGDTIKCDDSDLDGEVIFNENFDGYSDVNALEDAGWVIENISQGNTIFKIGKFSGNNYAQIIGQNSGENIIDSWLITPAINLDSTTNDELRYDIQASYDNGKVLTILVSTNFSGNIEDATWSILLDAHVPSGPPNTFGTFNTFGPVNTSCIVGSEIRFAFRYLGSDPSASTRYHIDNVRISGN